MSIRDSLTAKIDLKDAIFGGTSIYVSVLLVTYMFLFGTDFALRSFGVISSSGEFIAANATIPDSLLGIFVGILLSVFLITFFLVVLFDEAFFSRHEKGVVDLFGLGLVWGAVFVTIDTMIESFVIYVSMFRGDSGYYLLSLRSSLFGPFYWLAVLYIIFLPVSLYFLRKNHKEHYDKKKLEKK